MYIIMVKYYIRYIVSGYGAIKVDFHLMFINFTDLEWKVKYTKEKSIVVHYDLHNFILETK